jgi:hypothetical protein
MLHADIVVAGVRITFWTSHQSDIDCLHDFFRYHLYEKGHTVLKQSHDVIISSSREKTELETTSLRWSGVINVNNTIHWYDCEEPGESMIAIGNDIVVKHIVARRLTICYLRESAAWFHKSERPRLAGYIFFLLHSILSMYQTYCLHASCISKDNQACLFLGKSGEGKSTISYLLGRYGYEYMGDDLVFISKDDAGELVVDAFLSKIKMLNKKLETKEAIDIIKKHHFNYAYRRKLGAILKLQRTSVGNQSLLIPATHVEVFAWLMNSGNHIKIQYHPYVWMNICEEATALPAYTLMFADKAYFEPAILNNIL